MKHLSKREPLLKLIEDRSSTNHTNQGGIFQDNNRIKQNNLDVKN